MPIATPNLRARRSFLGRFAFGILLSAFVTSAVQAHPADISYLRVKVERQRVELRFTFNLLTLTQLAAIDANKDQHINKEEIDAAGPALSGYLNRHIQVRINDKPASLGAARQIEAVWPVSDGRQLQAPEADYAQRFVDIIFAQEMQPLLANLWLDFEIWNETGPLATVEATYEQDDLRMQVPFSMSKPDYLYDTGYATDQLFKEPAAAPTIPITSAVLCLIAALLAAALVARRLRSP